MVLFDVGEKTVVKKTEILNCPPDVASWDVFGVICPFFMPDAAEDFLAVVISMLGSECRCVPGWPSISYFHMCNGFMWTEK